MVESIVLAALLVGAIVLFWTQKLPSDLTAVLLMLALIVPWPHGDGAWHGLLSYTDAFAGFGSSAVIMIASMFVLGGALVQTGAAESLGVTVFRAVAAREWSLQLAILGVTTACSMFVNDTTTVLVFMPVIMTICHERNLAPSRYLIFAAYGALLGGQWTLIGTRSNIVISDITRSVTGHGLGFFDFAPTAAGILGLGAIYLVTVGRRLLPRTRHLRPAAADGTDDRAYLTEVAVAPASDAVGKPVRDLEWSKRQNVAVVDILRGERRLPPSFPLAEGDILIVRGSPKVMQDLLKTSDFQLKGEVAIDPETLQSVDLVTVEAVLAPQSSYIGRTLDEVDFQTLYRFTIMGVARTGRELSQRPGSLRLRFGDYLLLLGNVADLPRLRRNRNLILLGERAIPALGRRKAVMAIALLLAVIGTSMAGLVPPPASIPVAAALAVILGCISPQRAYESIDWSTVITLGSMIAFGVAIEKTGTAASVARFLVESLAGSPPVVLMGALLIVALLLTQLIENVAVAIIMAPIALAVASQADADPRPFMVGLAVCISSAFCTPVAHESTILVVGPGGYRFSDYLRVGSFLVFLTWSITLLITPMVWPFK